MRSSSDTVFFDKLQSARRETAPDGLVLVPSAHAWPHLILKLDVGLPVVIPYLVQEGNRGRDAHSTVSAAASGTLRHAVRHAVGRSGFQSWGMP